MTSRIRDEIDEIGRQSQREAYGEILIVVALISASIAGGIGFAAGMAYAIYRAL